MLSFMTSLASISLIAPATAELGGKVTGARSGEPFPSPVAIAVSLHADDGLCVAHTYTDVAGEYALEVAPGGYWLTVSIGKDEVWTERVHVSAGSKVHDLALSIPWDVPETPPRALARRS